jgi:hypothetical protein
MIHVRLSSHWRVRRSEWLLALAVTMIGIAYLRIPNLFEPRYFGTMLSVMPQHEWGWTATTIGTVRLVLLLINGAWRASPHGRTAGALLSCAFWMMLFMSAISAESTVQSVGLWLLFFVFDAFSAIDAAGDARMADEKARASRDARNGNVSGAC